MPALGWEALQDLHMLLGSGRLLCPVQDVKDRPVPAMLWWALLTYFAKNGRYLLVVS